MELVKAYAHDLYFESAGVILTLITLGKFLEARAKGSTSEAIRKLMDLSPKTALVERNGIEGEIPVEDLIKGDIIIVKPGKRIPADGIVTEGYTSMDESMITGESIPVEKKVGSKVTSGSINKTGFIKFTAEKVGDETTLSQIIKLVEEAQSTKAPIAKMADKISGIFVPVVLVISLVSTIVWLLLGHTFEFALSIGIAVLVISCPCALGLATPTAIMVGTGKGAENGILIKSGEALEIGHKIGTIVLDKTGTITIGKPEVKDIITFEDMDEIELLKIAASMEKGSEHPLAEAVIAAAEDKELTLYQPGDFDAIPGKGIRAKINDISYSIGNVKLMTEIGIDVSEHLELHEKLSKEGKTLLYLADNKLLGIISAADVVKPTSKEAIHTFQKMGIKVVMLTGDNQLTGEAIGQQVGVDTVIAEVMPADKEREVRRLQEGNKIVAMVGDGINDAPALARADIGIAIGAGTDVAIESADMVLMRSDLLDVASAIQLSKATIRNIKQNLFWAFFYNTAGIPLAAGVFYTILGWKLSPMFAAAAMSLSSVSVVTNALRLKGFKPKKYA
jgi:Cu+-exporting ATPase